MVTLSQTDDYVSSLGKCTCVQCTCVQCTCLHSLFVKNILSAGPETFFNITTNIGFLRDHYRSQHVSLFSEINRRVTVDSSISVFILTGPRLARWDLFPNLHRIS